MYASVDEIRAEGVSPEEADDARIQVAIKRASDLIDRITGRWFEPRERTLFFDGSGGFMLFLDVPIISVAEIKIDGQVVSLSNFVIYNSPEDRDFPRIFCNYGFPEGRRNVEVKGVFGYVDEVKDEQGNTVYVTPELIKYACRRLVVKDLAPLADGEAQEERKRVRIISETTDKHSYTLAQDQRFAGFTGDPEVDGILAQFMAPISIGSV